MNTYSLLSNIFKFFLQFFVVSIRILVFRVCVGSKFKELAMLTATLWKVLFVNKKKKELLKVFEKFDHKINTVRSIGRMGKHHFTNKKLFLKLLVFKIGSFSFSLNSWSHLKQIINYLNDWNYVCVSFLFPSLVASLSCGSS